MKRFSTILRHLRDQKSNIWLYSFSVLLAIIFGLVSLAGIGPFLKMLFDSSPVNLPATAPTLELSASSLSHYLQYQLGILVRDHGKPYALGLICLSVIIAIFLKNVFIYLSYRVLAPIRNHVMTSLRAGLYGKILQLPIGYFTEKRKGDINSRMSNDMNEIEWSVIGTMEGLIREPLTILFYLSTLVFLSPKLTGMVILMLPIAILVIGRLSKSLRRDSGEAQGELGNLMSILDETLGGLRVIKAFNAEKKIGDLFYKTNNQLNYLRNKIAFRRDMASPLSEVLGVMILCTILWYGGSKVLVGDLTLTADNFIYYIIVFSQIINPAKSLSTAFYNAQRGSAAIQRIEEMMQANVAIRELDQPKTLSTFTSKIEFRNVSFSYEDVMVLDGINLVIEKGKTVALVGSSGSGKSTLMDLIPRFHDVSSGEILIDGINIKEYSIATLRHHMGIVTQEPVLFNDSIAANISLGDSNANIAEIEDAARIANSHDFIIKKEEGYQTNIGDRGTKLSGGERQRLTIARAVLKNPPILLLDEATSSLDTESERLVQDAIGKMMQNRTTVVIAHRLSTIRHADEILVMQKGQIIERGTHEELIALNSFYKKLVEMQEIS